MTGGVITYGVGNFLQGGGAVDSIVWVKDVGTFGVHDEEGRGYTHRVPATDHGDAREAVRRWDMGDIRGRRRTRASGNTVGEDLHRAMAGNSGAVGGAKLLN